MRVKRYKKARKVLSFFNLSFGFKAPYKVLMDAEFIAAALESRVQLSEQIPNFLQDESKLFVTKCIVSDLEQRAQRDTFWKGALLIAKKMNYLRCAHEELAHPHDCIKVLMQKSSDDYSKESREKAKRKAASGEGKKDADGSDSSAPTDSTEGAIQSANKEDEKTDKNTNSKRDNFDLNTAGKGRSKKIIYNAEKLILALQHIPLREELSRIPAIPFLHFNKSALVLDDPSPATVAYADKVRSGLAFTSTNAQTGRAVLERLSKIHGVQIDVHDLHTGTLQNIVGELTEKEKAKLEAEKREKARLLASQGVVLTKKAKAPNPLAVKKKKARQDPSKQGKKNKKDKTDASSQDNKEKTETSADSTDAEKAAAAAEAEKRKRKRKRKSGDTGESGNTSDSTGSSSSNGTSDSTTSKDTNTDADASKKSRKKQKTSANTSKDTSKTKPNNTPIDSLERRIRTYSTPEEAFKAKPSIGRKTYHVVNKHNKLAKQKEQIVAQALKEGVDLTDYAL